MFQNRHDEDVRLRVPPTDDYTRGGRPGDAVRPEHPQQPIVHHHAFILVDPKTTLAVATVLAQISRGLRNEGAARGNPLESDFDDGGLQFFARLAYPVDLAGRKMVNRDNHQEVESSKDHKAPRRPSL